ncbi:MULTISPECIES: hypothetical protein [unclassified Crossiella]|uniref:nSTAND1 domain-containing NTPase n=1 Tax=unclassified Crossiella TaxID=2620835 RepID=UPI001FFEF4E6|nr:MULTISPECIES: hypothetical protein [unclassified Crossiella]MCK2244825.1 hypothetical protein [Crossiella sp. S99.2]MCK2258467.1 hypothetical protein [Crossiella sp. S99.1]
MPRAEQPLESGDGALPRFAADLRALRRQAGGIPYRTLAKRAHVSASVLSAAAGGRKLPSLVVTLAYVRACAGDVAGWEQRWHAVAAELADTPPPATPGPEPYLGLGAFQIEDAARFFGRAQLVAELDGLVRRHRFVAVVGPSGSGKSSLLRAGLLHQVRAAGLPTVLLTPGPRPVEECAVRLAALTGRSAAELLREFADPATLHLTVLQALADRPPETELVLVADQFEELFTLCAEEAERARFLTLLSTAAGAPTSRVRIVLGVRADFYGHCTRYPELVPVLRAAQLVVGPLSTAELREVITRPAVEAGAVPETALVSQVIAEATGRPGVLPLVSHALLETWRRRRGSALTLSGYQASGGITHAIAHTAETVYIGLNGEQQAWARQLFLRLIALGEGAEDTGRRVRRAELDLADPAATEVLDRLAEARLIVLDTDSVQITHEALIRCWPRLREWLATDREGLRLHRQLTEAAAQWETLARDPGALYRGTRLSLARDFAVAHRPMLTEGETRFLRASVAVHEDETARAGRQNRRLRRLVAAVVGFALVAATAAVVAVQQRSTALAQRDEAVFRQTVAEADRLRESDPSLSAQLLLTAHRLRPAEEQVRTRLLGTQRSALATALSGHGGNVYLTTFSPRGELLASAGEDGQVRLWDVRDRTSPRPLGQPLRGHKGWLSAAVFSPDGRVLASSGEDGTVLLWDLANPDRPIRLGEPLRTGEGSIYLVAFSPDGRILAAGNDNRTVRLWQVADPARPVLLERPLAGHTGPVRSLAFSPDGRSLASGGDDTTALLWDIGDPARPARRGKPLTGHGFLVHSVAFSPDSRTVATGSQDNTVRLWSAADGSPLGPPLTGHTGGVWSVAFSPVNPAILASGAADGTARLWNVANPGTAAPLGTPLAGGGDVFAVGFSPDGATLATGSSDHLVRLWSLPAAQLIGHRSTVNMVAFSRDGRLAATGAKDNTVRLWDTATPATPRQLGEIPAVPGVLKSCSACRTYTRFSPDGRTLAVLSHGKILQLWGVADPARPRPISSMRTLGTRHTAALAYSPDGRTLITGDTEETGQLWDISDPAHPAPVSRLTGHEGYLGHAEFSPDGRILATASGDHTVRLWQVDNPREPRLLGKITGHQGAVVAVAFSPDSRSLATASADQSVRLWRIDNPAAPEQLGAALTGHGRSVSAVAFSPDGATLASTSTDATLRRWHTGPAPGPLGEPISTGNGDGYALAFTPDGRHLATADGSGAVHLLDLDVEQAIQRVCATTRGVLTDRKRETHLPGVANPRPCG